MGGELSGGGGVSSAGLVEFIGLETIGVTLLDGSLESSVVDGVDGVDFIGVAGWIMITGCLVIV